jgi:hypothetical protein
MRSPDARLLKLEAHYRPPTLSAGDLRGAVAAIAAELGVTEAQVLAEVEACRAAVEASGLDPEVFVAGELGMTVEAVRAEARRFAGVGMGTI